MPLTFPMTNTCINRGAGLQACGGRLRPPVPLREERVLEDPRRPGGPPHNVPQHFPTLRKVSGIGQDCPLTNAILTCQISAGRTPHQRVARIICLWTVCCS